MEERDLSKRKCDVCRPGTPPIDEARAAELEQAIDAAWEREATAWLRRTFRFGNFRDAFGFATRVALLAEDEGHHPDLDVGWGRVSVKLRTHVAKGLTDNDFIMAAKVDRLEGESGARPGAR